MTPITPPQVHDRRSLLIRDLRTVFVTILMLFSWAFAAHNLAEATKEPEDTRRYAGCMFPQFDGQAVTWARADGKVYCWESR